LAKAFTHADLRTAMGCIEYRDTDAFIDEIAAAYKDIDVVMQDAQDLGPLRCSGRMCREVPPQRLQPCPRNRPA
jgi:RNA-splicing ligase RtcB